MYCGNIQYFSRNKENKMKLIIGKALLEEEEIELESFEGLIEMLFVKGIQKETLDCALIYLLRLSDNYIEVIPEALVHFVEECLREA
jgi:hypothetical protein